jgi:putative membrane protein
MRRITYATLIPALLLGGCAGGGGGSRVAPPPRPAAAAAIAPALAAAAYVAMAASIDLFEIQSAQLAMERARDPANRDFAQRALRAHEGTSAQLSMAGRRLNLLPSPTLIPEHQAMLNALRTAPDFDRTYRAQQTALHREGVALHGGYARGGTSPTLRPVAKNAEDVMRRNQEALGR